MTILNCFKCDKELEPVFSDNKFSDNQPYGGTTFLSYGQYGSTVFDPGDGTYLVINICDECLPANKEQVLLGKRGQKELVEWEIDSVS
jgi:hypothetical protein